MYDNLESFQKVVARTFHLFCEKTSENNLLVGSEQLQNCSCYTLIIRSPRQILQGRDILFLPTRGTFSLSRRKERFV